MHPRLSVLAGFAAAALVAASLVSATGVALAPKRLVLVLADLPAGYTLDRASSGPRTFAEAASGESPSYKANLRRWGYLGGYDAVFEADDQLERPVIMSQAVVYRTEAGATAGYTAGLKRAAAQVRELRTATAVGDERHLFTGLQRASGHTYRVYLLAWRRGRVVATVSVIGLPGKTPVAPVPPLARTQDKRIATALARE